MAIDVASLLGKERQSFEDQYSDPRWIARAKGFRSKYGNFCMSCRRSGLVIGVHHVNYERGKKLWEHDDEDLACLCDECHNSIHNTIRAFRRIAARCNARNIAAITGLVHELIQEHGDRDTALKIARLLT